MKMGVRQFATACRETPAAGALGFIYGGKGIVLSSAQLMNNRQGEIGWFFSHTGLHRWCYCSRDGVGDGLIFGQGGWRLGVIQKVAKLLVDNGWKWGSGVSPRHGEENVSV